MRYLIVILIFIFHCLASEAQIKFPLRRYTMDNLIDSSGNGANLKAYGDASITTGNKAVGTGSGVTDGYGDYWRVPITDLGTQGFVSFWAYSNNLVSDTRAIICLAYHTDRYYMYTQEVSNVRLTTPGGDRASAGTISYTTWINYVWYFNKTSGIARLWQNGTRVNLADSIIATGFRTNDSIYIGIDDYRNAGWLGGIDEVMMYTGYAPTEAQIDSIYAKTYIGAVSEPAYNPPNLKAYYNGIYKRSSYSSIPFGTHNNYMSYGETVSESQNILTMYDGNCPSGGNRLTDHDCANVTFTYAPLRALKNPSDYANKIYIDPSYSGTESGTIAQPYNSWTDVGTPASNTAYLFKAGTTLTHSTSIQITNSYTNVYFGWYDEIAGLYVRPKIICTTAVSVFDIRSTNSTIRDLDISCPNFTHSVDGNGVTVGSGIAVMLWNATADNFDLYNCVLHDAFLGFFSYGVDTRVIGNEMYDLYTDGIWNAGFPATPLDYTEIAYNNIHDVNLAWFDYSYDPTNDKLSPGDAIQIEYYYREMWIHDNIVDRSNSSNKQTILFNTSDVYHTSMMIRAILEDNTIVSPKQTGKGVPAVNFHGGGVTSANRYVCARNNFYTLDANPNTGLWSETSNDSVYANVFRDFKYGIHIASGNAFIDNNTFVRNTQAVYQGTATTLRNNIFWLNTANYTGVNTGTVQTNLTSDPSFVNTAGNDFHLQPGSAAIDAGTTLPFYKLNLDKEPIVGATNIGAY